MLYVEVGMRTLVKQETFLLLYTVRLSHRCGRRWRVSQGS